MYSQPADSARVDIFNLIRPSFELMEFIADSKFVNDYKTAGARLANDIGFKLIPENPADLHSTAPIEKLQFISKDEGITLTIFQNDDGDFLFDKWKTDLKALGLKSDIRNDEGGSVFFKVKTTQGAVGSFFYNGRNLFEIVIDLPFAVESWDSLDAASVTLVRKKYAILNRILGSIARTYVIREEFMFYPSAHLSQEQRLYGLIQFWTEVKYNFAYFDHVPDLNWDHVLAKYITIIQEDQSVETYYDNLSRMCALLKDGHTNIYKPNRIEAVLASPPLQLTNIQNKAIVSNTDESLKLLIPIGSEITRVDGIPTQEYLSEKVFPFISSSTEHILFDNGIRTMLKGHIGTQVNIEYKTPKGQLFTQSLTRTNKPVTWTVITPKVQPFEFKRLPKNIAYVAINTFGNNKVVTDFENHIDSINSCSKLIIDLRGNGGGNSSNAYRIIEHLTDKPFVTSKWRTREHRAAHKAWGGFRADNFRNAARSKKEALSDWEKMTVEYYKGERWYGEAPETIDPPSNKKIKLPVVVLIGHKTASAAEDFLIALDNTKRSTTIGSKTFGSTGQPLSFKLPGGGSARVCTKRDEYPDGRQFVGVGIKPDIEIENSVEDLLAGRDAVLLKAQEIVTGLKR
ncbi:MAG TPA: S41 family peptidase [Chryseosolibacter sp.]